VSQGTPAPCRVLDPRSSADARWGGASGSILETRSIPGCDLPAKNENSREGA
jgi:hypothetical protein